MSAGVTAFLFTDLVSSTEARERMGDDGFENLRRTHFRSSYQRDGGQASTGSSLR